MDRSAVVKALATAIRNTVGAHARNDSEFLDNMTEATTMQQIEDQFQMDSLDHIEIVMDLEEQLETEISDDLAEAMFDVKLNVGQFVDRMTAHKADKVPA